jgi:predicted site-specific integrase-resolvase
MNEVQDQERFDPLSEYLTPRETAEALRISPRTLDNWHARREGPARTVVAGKRYYAKSEIERWLLAQQEPTPVRSRGRRA